MSVDRRISRTARASGRSSFAARSIGHLRLYESLQMLVPALVGILAEGTPPPWPRLLLYVVAHVAHVLSVYSYNDYCDHDHDLVNPRKAVAGATSRRWLGAQTILLGALFLAAALALRSRAGLLLLIAQIVCMAYSHPGIRLKGRLLGGELAHFVAGFLYYASGATLAGAALGDHLLGGAIFGLLYVSGGTVNEVMDYEPDRRARLRHLVLSVGKRRGLRGVLFVHYVCFVLLAIAYPSLPLIVASALAIPLYALATRGLLQQLDDPARLLAFRRRYRVIFGALLVVLCVARGVELVEGPRSEPATVEGPHGTSAVD